MPNIGGVLMNKISSIIPTNSRISTVDMKGSMPVRRGVPSFGREVVSPSNHRPLAKTTLEEAAFTNELYQNSKEKMKAQSAMAENIGKEFFEVTVPEINNSEVEIDMPVIEMPETMTSDISSRADVPLAVVGQNLDVVG